MAGDGTVGRGAGDTLLDRTAASAPDLGSARILLVLAQDQERDLIGAALEQRGYDVVTSEHGDAIGAALRANAIDVVILDDGIAHAGGVEAIQGERRYADLPIIVIGDGQVARGDVATGVDHQLARPIDSRLLVERVRMSLRTRRSLLGMEAAHSVVASLANELLAPETDVRLHTERLGTYTSELGRRAGLSASELNAIAYGTLLHDLAKLGIAESILSKPGPLTDEERAAMQRHTEIGERIAAPLAGAERLGPILRHHHERWDGKGYPDGLTGSQTPMGARIIGIVDAFDAMTQYRTYRQPMTVPAAVDELRRERGAQFDPTLVDAFIEVLEWDGLI